MKIDYIWTDGNQEHRFIGEDAFLRAQSVRELRGQGKVWRREFDEEGLLERVTNVTLECVSKEAKKI